MHSFNAILPIRFTIIMLGILLLSFKDIRSGPDNLKLSSDAVVVDSLEHESLIASIISKSPVFTSEPNPIITEPTSEKTYYAIVKGKIYLIGSIKGNFTGAGIAELSNQKELLRMYNAFKNIIREADAIMRNLKQIEWERNFSAVIMQSVEDQKLIINAMREGVAEDERERGCFVKIYREKGKYKLSMEEGFMVSNSNNQINFIFPGNDRDNIRLVNDRGEVIVGTIHLHNHDRGLSGSNPGESPDEAGDVANVKFTKIPWMTVGPKKIHLGYLTDYNKVVIEETESYNMVQQILKRNAIAL